MTTALEPASIHDYSTGTRCAELSNIKVQEALLVTPPLGLVFAPAHAGLVTGIQTASSKAERKKDSPIGVIIP